MLRLPALLLLAIAAALASLAAGDERTHQYAPGDPVTLYVNKVGPFNNPTLTYPYHALPFCRPDAAAGAKPRRRFGGLGEILTGNALEDSQLTLKFGVPVPATPVCSQTLDAKAAAAFAKAARRRWWYEMFLDDLPLWGHVSPVAADETAEPSVFTHQAFTVSVNGDRIVGVALRTDNPVPVREGATLAFTYSVAWSPSDVPFARRFDALLDPAFFEAPVRAFSLLNAALMVLVLVGLTAGILIKTIRQDYRRYDDDARLDAVEREDGGKAAAYAAGEESGWKACSGDVFRTPRRADLLSALTGAGAQLTAVAALSVLTASAGDLFTDRGAVTSVAVAAYALTAALGGFVSGSHYARVGGRRWVRCALLTAGAFPLAVGAIGLCLNTLAVFYRSLAAVSFLAAASVGAVWLLCATPLTLLGTVLGKKLAGTPDAPCRVKRVPSPIPSPPTWWLHPGVLIAAGGALPFGAIFIEVFYLLSALFSHKIYYVYGTLALVLALLTVVTACVAIVATYLSLNLGENYHWQWLSFGTGASVGGWVFLYGAHYFFTKTRMSGLFQAAFFFGHTAMLCAGLACAMGAIAHLSASAFVKKIYRGVKCD